MKLSDLEYMTDSKVTYIETLDGDVCASLPRCETVRGAILTSACAFAPTKREARKALAAKLSNQTLVKNAYSDRMEWKLSALTVG